MSSPSHWVFAYGSNMHEPDLRRWLSTHHPGVSPPTEVVSAELPGYELVWNYWSPVRGGGAANAQPSRDDRVLYGALLRVNHDTLLALDQKEGHPTRYSRSPTPLLCRSLDGRRKVEAWVYQVSDQYRLDSPVYPTADYLNLLIEGARTLNLPAPYLRWLLQTTIAI